MSPFSLISPLGEKRAGVGREREGNKILLDESDVVAMHMFLYFIDFFRQTLSDAVELIVSRTIRVLDLESDFREAKRWRVIN